MCVAMLQGRIMAAQTVLFAVHSLSDLPFAIMNEGFLKIRIPRKFSFPYRPLLTRRSNFYLTYLPLFVL